MSSVSPVVVVLIVVAVLVIAAVIALLLRSRGRLKARRQGQALDHHREAQRLAAEAESAQAAAEERTAAARRERAEAELRAVDVERDAEATLHEAELKQAEAERLKAKAAKLDPGIDPHATADVRQRMPARDHQGNTYADGRRDDRGDRVTDDPANASGRDADAPPRGDRGGGTVDPR